MPSSNELLENTTKVNSEQIKDSIITSFIKIKRSEIVDQENIISTIEENFDKNQQSLIMCCKEQPILLLLMTKGGITIYHKQFSDRKEKFMSPSIQLISGYLTALNEFSNEILENKLDQITSGDHTLLLRSLSSSYLCYLFKGDIEDAKGTTEVIETSLKENQLLWNAVSELERIGKPISKSVRKSVDNMMESLVIGSKFHF